MIIRTRPVFPENDPTFDFLNKFFEKHFEDVTESGARYKGTRNRVNWPDIRNWLTVIRARAGKMAPSEKACEAALSLWQRYKTEEAEFETLQKIDYAGPNDALEQFLLATTGQVNPLDLAVMKHFIWQVKRKLNELEVIYHMMPVLVGRTGKGKSVAINKFLAPVRTLAETGKDFGIFSDDRQWHLFGEKYIFLFDEMSKARKVDVESLKNTITADVKSYRPLHTNSTNMVPQNGTFLGASNDPIYSLINDHTSARRFWQIDFSDNPDRELLNSLDFTKIWSGIDETQPCFLLPYIDQITQKQHEHLRAKSNPEQWFDECAFAVGDCLQPAAKLYARFREWEDLHDPRAKTASKVFFQRLRDLPDIKHRKKAEGSFYNIELRPVDAPKGQMYVVK